VGIPFVSLRTGVKSAGPEHKIQQPRDLPETYSREFLDPMHDHQVIGGNDKRDLPAIP
jgi:hypothetical protein